MKNLVLLAPPLNTFTKLRYKFNPSTAIQQNVERIKYCNSPATTWQPMRGDTLSAPAKKIMSNALNEKDRLIKILGGSFLRSFLQETIHANRQFVEESVF